jgi:hypothetical protein
MPPEHRSASGAHGHGAGFAAKRDHLSTYKAGLYLLELWHYATIIFYAMS